MAWMSFVCFCQIFFLERCQPEVQRRHSMKSMSIHNDETHSLEHHMTLTINE
jgi:hypothetical protein